MSVRFTKPFDGAELLDLLQDTRSAIVLGEYFGSDYPPGADLPFSGGYFNFIGGGRDKIVSANRITAEDLIALQTLSVQVPVRVAVALLEGRLARQLSSLLARIPLHMDLTDADLRHIDVGSPADLAWHLLDDQPGVGWVTAGKLLARKRPHLLPIYDDVVRCALGWRGNFWLALHAALRADNQHLQRRLVELRHESGVPDWVTALRVLDVVIWMRHQESHALQTVGGWRGDPGDRRSGISRD